MKILSDADVSNQKILDMANSPVSEDALPYAQSGEYFDWTPVLKRVDGVTIPVDSINQTNTKYNRNASLITAVAHVNFAASPAFPSATASDVITTSLPFPARVTSSEGLIAGFYELATDAPNGPRNGPRIMYGNFRILDKDRAEATVVGEGGVNLANIGAQRYVRWNDSAPDPYSDYMTPPGVYEGNGFSAAFNPWELLTVRWLETITSGSTYSRMYIYLKYEAL